MCQEALVRNARRRGKSSLKTVSSNPFVALLHAVKCAVLYGVGKEACAWYLLAFVEIGLAFFFHLFFFPVPRLRRALLNSRRQCSLMHERGCPESAEASPRTSMGSEGRVALVPRLMYGAHIFDAM